jgi:predicted enzyme related to lactoylglutathione lyase
LHRSIYVSDNIEGAYQFAQEKGIEIVLELETPHPGLSFFNLKDPDGNVFMVCSTDYEALPIKPMLKDSPIHNRIGTVFVNVKNMNQSIEWYSSLLDLPINSSYNGDSIYELDTEGGARILLDNNRFLQGDDYKISFMFVTNNIDQAYQNLKEKDIEIFTEIERYPDSVSFFTFKDPDGNILMVCEKTER